MSFRYSPQFGRRAECKLHRPVRPPVPPKSWASARELLETFNSAVVLNQIEAALRDYVQDGS